MKAVNQLRGELKHFLRNELAKKTLGSLRRRANARNVSFRISLRWPIYIVNSVDKTKLSSIMLAHKEFSRMSLNFAGSPLSAKTSNVKCISSFDQSLQKLWENISTSLS